MCLKVPWFAEYARSVMCAGAIEMREIVLVHAGKHVQRSSARFATRQRRLAWPLREDDTEKSRSVTHIRYLSQFCKSKSNVGNKFYTPAAHPRRHNMVVDVHGRRSSREHRARVADRCGSQCTGDSYVNFHAHMWSFGRVPHALSHFGSAQANHQVGMAGIDLEQLAAWAALAANDDAQAEEAKRRRTAPARAARQLKVAMFELSEQKQATARAENQLALASELVSECRTLLSIPRRRCADQELAIFVKMWGLQRLACLPRQKGALLVKQNTACRLVATAMLHKQEVAFRTMVAHARAAHSAARHPCPRPAGEPLPGGSELSELCDQFRCSAFLGVRLMWDEAGQRMRPLLDRLAAEGRNGPTGSSQTILQVMTLSCHLFAVAMKQDLRTGRFVSVERWQPWLTPMRIMENTSTNCVLEALVTSMPFCMDTAHPSRSAVLDATDATIFVFICDSASSNIRAVKWFLAQAATLGPKVLMHVEACSTHQVHIVKATCLDMLELSGTLYSWTCLLRLSSSLKSLQSSLKHALSSMLIIRCGRQPPAAADDFMFKVHSVFNIDGTEEFLFSICKDGSKKPTAFLETLVDLSRLCEFTPAGDVIAYTGEFPHAPAGRVREFAIERIMQPLDALFVERRWSIAAVSRWTHVMENLKRVVLGCLCGRLIIHAISGMTTRLTVSEADMDAALTKAQRRELETGESPNMSWAKDGKRLLKVARYMASPGRSWQLGCILLTASICDALHYGITGTKRGRANLHTMVDPADSIVGKALQNACEMCSDFRFEGDSPWATLASLGAPPASSVELRLFARKLLLTISCGIFRRLEVKFSSGVYRLYWMISPNTSDADRGYLANELLTADVHCLPSFVKHFLQLCPTVQTITGPVGQQIVKTLSNSLVFSTDEVERENAHCRRACHSDGHGRQHKPTTSYELCRKLKEHHLQRGGLDPSKARASPAVIDRMRAAPVATSHFLAPPQPEPTPAPALVDQPPEPAQAAAATKRRALAATGASARKVLKDFRKPCACALFQKLSSLICVTIGPRGFSVNGGATHPICRAFASALVWFPF